MNNEVLKEILLSRLPAKRRTFPIKIDEKGIILFRITKHENINIHAMCEISDSIVMVEIEDYNSSPEYELFQISYNLISFNILVNKKETTRENPSVITCYFVDNEEGFNISNSNSLEEVISVGKLIISLILLTIEKFIKSISTSYTMEEFGYINF